jgi:hypothetical protein
VIEALITSAGYSPGERLTNPGGSPAQVTPVSTTSTVIQLATAVTSGIAVQNKSTGALTTLASSASWKYRFEASRGW